jgi:hypothetical protein
MLIKIVIEYDNDNDNDNDPIKEWEDWKQFNVDMIDVVRTGGLVTFNGIKITEEMTND